MNATAPKHAPAPASVTTPLLYGNGYGSTAATAPAGDGASDRKPEAHSPPPPSAPHRAAATALAVNRAQRIVIAVLAALHISRGILLLALPALGLGLPGLVDLPPPLSGNGAGDGASLVLLVSGLLGVRDVVLGGLLAMADRRSDREVRRALAVNLLSDAVDTFVLIFAAACWRQHRHSPVAEIGVVATLAIVEHVTLWTMAADHEGGAYRPAAAVAAYQSRLQASEDKQLRLDMWFADMRRSEEMRQPSSPAKLPQ